MSKSLSVNINPVAVLRASVGTRYPDPVQASIDSEQGGADSVGLYLCGDERSIQKRDVRLVQAVLLTRMNLKIALTPEMLAFVEELKPAQCCLVPEDGSQCTAQGGLNVVDNIFRFRDAARRLREHGVRVGLFIDPEIRQVEAAARCDVLDVEFNMRRYSTTPDDETSENEVINLAKCSECARDLGLRTNVSGGLNYQNISDIASLDGVSTIEVGHAIFSRALFTGLQEAIREMKMLIHTAPLS